MVDLEAGNTIDMAAQIVYNNNVFSLALPRRACRSIFLAGKRFLCKVCKKHRKFIQGAQELNENRHLHYSI